MVPEGKLPRDRFKGPANKIARKGFLPHMSKFKPYLITAAVVLAVLFVLVNVAPASIRSKFLPSA